MKMEEVLSIEILEHVPIIRHRIPKEKPSDNQQLR